MATSYINILYRTYVPPLSNPNIEPRIQHIWATCCWFYCNDLSSQLKPVIEEFFTSEEYKTGAPGPTSINPSPPWVPDSQRVVGRPFNLAGWLNEHRTLISTTGSYPLFPPSSYQSDILVLGLGRGSRQVKSPSETFLW